MIIDTNTIPEGHWHFERLCDLESVRANLPSNKGINCIIDSTRNNNTILLQIKFNGYFELECSRCLETYKHPVGGELTVTLKESNTPLLSSREENDILFFNSENSSIDLTSLLYEEIILSLPLKPLCKEECEGIKYQKKQKNESSDPRWDKLKIFLKNGK